MKWRKMGHVFAPDGRLPWQQKYGYPPVPMHVGNNILRIYVAFCDANTVGRLGFVEVDADNPGRVLRVSERPLLDVGHPGDFDENGVVPTCVLRVGGQLFLYYVGYQLGHQVRYYQFQGLAISDDDGRTFRRHSRVPIIDRSDGESLNRTSSFVMHDNGSYRMWYVGGGEWTTVNGKTLPVYQMRHIESPDGKTWPSHGRVCLDFANDDEHAFGKPWVLRDGDRYRMWYSVRTRSKDYRIGYAESSDGASWTRKDDQVGIDVSPHGWDSQMIAYASVVRQKDRAYMFYCGNNCGEAGFGYAVCEEW